jgi:CHAD domain-containing protein
MKARRVKGLDPDASLADNLERIVAVRLDELCSFVPKALDPARVKALHDMRIAAKRVRYILEVAAEPCFGPYATTAIKRAKDLQDLLGELHDCDVQLPRVRALQEELRAADALEARARAGAAPDLDPTLASGTPHADSWRGLETMAIYLEARRGLLFERFLELWQSLERDGFRARLEYAISERPAPFTPPSQEGNGAAPATPIASPIEDDG